MPQDEDFIAPGRIDFLIAEVKAGECRLNGPWVDPGKRNIQYVLRWMGFLPSEGDLDIVSQALYERKRWEDPQGPFSVRMAAFGERRSARRGMRTVLQRTHRESVTFIIDRFRRFDTEKADHRQWDDFIRQLFDMASKGVDVGRILEWIDGGARP
jgi:hypothetical protein